jgi:hypothetical protein
MQNRYVGIFFFTESEELSSGFAMFRLHPKLTFLAHQDYKVPEQRATSSVQLNPSLSLPAQKLDE